MLTLGLALTLLSAPRDSVTVAQVHAAYGQVFTVIIQPAGADTLVGALVNTQIPAANPLSALVSAAPSLFTYLLQHGTDFALPDILTGPKDQARLQRLLDSALQQDERFNRLLLPLVGASLAEEGAGLTGYAPPTSRESISIDSAAFIGARFFYPDSFGPDGKLRSRICSGRNGLPEDAHDSALILEAFVFDALSTALLGGPFPAVQEYQDTVRATLAVLPPNLDSAERLIEIRKAAWTRLAASTSVKRTIEERYVILAPILPFQLH